MKWIIVLFALSAWAGPTQSVDMILTGRTAAGPHPNEDLAIRKMIASYIEKLSVRHYWLLETPPNGGFHVCVEPSGAAGFSHIIDEINRIAIRESVWEPSLVDKCAR